MKLQLKLSICVLLLALLIESSLQQSSISLSEAQWFVSNYNNSINVPAFIPGGIYNDLKRNNVLKQDILFGRNDVAYRWVGHENWTYQASFSIDNNVARSQSVKLVLHGVDTISTVFLNGKILGTTENMFVRYKFDIKPFLKLAGLTNSLIISFESPIKYAARKSHQSLRQNHGKIIPPYCPSPAQRGECHVNFIRKMQSSFSWDWGPAFPSVGLYKDVSLEFGSHGIIRDILVETRRIVKPNISKSLNQVPSKIFINSNLGHHIFKISEHNKTLPYNRAPPFLISNHVEKFESPYQLDGQDPFNREKFIESSLVTQTEEWLLKVTLVIEMNQPNQSYDLRVEFNLHDTLHYESEHPGTISNNDGVIRLGFNLKIDSSRMKVDAWWPNNLGNQTLYKLGARVMPMNYSPYKIRIYPYLPDTQQRTARQATISNQRDVFIAAMKDQLDHISQQLILSEKSISIGFRTVELIQEPVQGSVNNGMTFNFRINGVDIFAMGSNWIPSSILPENSNNINQIRYLLQSAKDANMNMLRVWGGGLYESDEFYQLADSMGIMIWHDLMFACALYPATDEFLNSVKVEIEQQVQRLQHHPSIIIWAGNNENEMAISGTWWPEYLLWSKKLKEMYHRLYVETIRPIVQTIDPTRPYVDSSPSNGLMTGNQPYSISRLPNDNKFGDVHHYDYISDSFDWTTYPSTRFASEYGFQSYPSFSALAMISIPADWKFPLTNNILHRQHRLTGEVEIRHQIRMHFREPSSGGIDKLKTFIYLSQLTQAIAIKTETEFYRRNRFIADNGLGKTMGALYWQLNDVWAAPSWSSIEIGGKWKPLHYFARRFFFPIQVVPYIQSSQSYVPTSLQQDSIMLQGIQSIAQTNQSNSNVAQSSIFVVDLIRDDMFVKLTSFNVSIKLYRWTSFSPIWEDRIYILNVQPMNVTRIYEQELNKILRQVSRPVSLSGCVFTVTIEQEPTFGLSHIDNYLMPVYPNKITAMRVPTITVVQIQGPFHLDELANSGEHGSSSQWECAFRLTLMSDSIAMFVWLDLNVIRLSFTSATARSRSPVENVSGIQASNAATIGALNDSLSTVASQNLRLRRRMDANIDNRGVEGSDSDLNSRVRFTVSPSSNIANNNNNSKSQKSYVPATGIGLDTVSFRFTDNGFNMFEQEKTVDLYLTKCLRKEQIEMSVEIQSLADSL